MNKLSPFSRLLFFIASGILFIVLFLPIWRIELDAPQYPEGLALTIHANKLGGDVDVVNGLNHYIGMKTLHAEEFVEFKVLPYIISFFGFLGVILALANRRKWLYVWLGLFLTFAVLAMVDFWRWEYNYGHDLDPTAPIQVPGMAYQPPLIGFKQLLNFGAYSIPAAGGWIFIASGVIGLLAVILEWKRPKTNKLNTTVIAILVLISFNACQMGPKKIQYGTDACSFCRMTLTDSKFGGEIISSKGKVFIFDDMACLNNFRKENFKRAEDIKSVHFINYLKPGEFLDADLCYFLKSSQIQSPMGSGYAAFVSINEINKFTEGKDKGEIKSWSDFIHP